jgi:undecaprenyl-diphosphatase
MSLLQAIILGIVQGLTEFIPVSSTAHLIFAGRALDLFANVDQTVRAEQTTASIAVIQLGTLLAVLIYFAGDIISITESFIRDHVAYVREPKVRAKGFWGSLSDDARLGWLVVIGSLPIGLIGLKLKKLIEGPNTKNLWLIATMMICIAVLLAVAEKVSSKRRQMQDLGVRDAVVVGFSQVLALIPGSSRSGSTIMGGLFAGETRETAARFSFLLSIPAIAASGLLELREAIHKLPSGSYVSLAIATAIAGVVGYASIWFLLRFLRTHSTVVFIGYRLILGAVLLALLSIGAIKPIDNYAAAHSKQGRPPVRADGMAPTPGNADNIRQVSVN